MRKFASIFTLLFALGLGLAAGRWYFMAPVKRNNPRPVAMKPSLDPQSPEPQPSSTPQPSEPQPPPPAGVAFTPPAYDFGSPLEGEARTCTLKITRPPGSALKLGRIYSTCPCIAASAGKLIFSPEEPAAVAVSLHSLTVEGKKSFSVFAEVLEPAKGTLRADVTTDVKRVPAKITLVPDTIHFGAASGAKTASVKLLNLTYQPLSLSVHSCSLKDVTVSVLEGGVISPGQAATVSAEIPAAGLPPGPIQGVVLLETNCAEHAQIIISIDGTSLPAK